MNNLYNLAMAITLAILYGLDNPIENKSLNESQKKDLFTAAKKIYKSDFQADTDHPTFISELKALLKK